MCEATFCVSPRLVSPDVHRHDWGLTVGLIRDKLGDLVTAMEDEALKWFAFAALPPTEMDHHARWHAIIAPAMLERAYITLVAHLIEADVQFSRDLIHGHVREVLLQPLAVLSPRRLLGEATVDHLDRTAVVPLREGIWMEIEGSPRSVWESPVPQRSPEDCLCRRRAIATEVGALLVDP